MGPCLMPYSASSLLMSSSLLSVRAMCSSSRQPVSLRGRQDTAVSALQSQERNQSAPGAIFVPCCYSVVAVQANFTRLTQTRPAPGPDHSHLANNTDERLKMILKFRFVGFKFKPKDSTHLWITLKSWAELRQGGRGTVGGTSGNIWRRNLTLLRASSSSWLTRIYSHIYMFNFIWKILHAYTEMC